MVIGYNFNRITNASNKVVEIVAYFKIIASGAQYENGFGFQIPNLNSSQIQSVTGYSHTKSYITINGNGTEADQNNAVIIPFDNIYSFFDDGFINTSYTRGSHGVAPVNLTVTIKIPDTQSLTLSDVGLPPFNPFMIIDGNRSQEVHLANYEPTDLADLSGVSAPYYKDVNNLPWALNFAEEFNYPLEKIDIRDAYSMFEEWRTSDGASNTDWYLLENGSTDKIYVEQEIQTGTVTDIDGNVYKTVKIGNQWWMAENLKVTKYRNGESIMNVAGGGTEWSFLDTNETSAYCAHDSVESNADTYGYLYNWYAVDDSRNIAPEGWHVPTDEELKVLQIALGMEPSEADRIGWRGTNEGSKLAGRADLWDDGSLDNNAEFGTSGFTGLPAGYRGYDGAFGSIGNDATFWSASEYYTDYAWYRSLLYINSDVNRSNYRKRYGFGVRCVRD